MIMVLIGPRNHDISKAMVSETSAWSRCYEIRSVN